MCGKVHSSNTTRTQHTHTHTHGLQSEIGTEAVGCHVDVQCQGQHVGGNEIHIAPRRHGEHALIFADRIERVEQFNRDLHHDTAVSAPCIVTATCGHVFVRRSIAVMELSAMLPHGQRQDHTHRQSVTSS